MSILSSPRERAPPLPIAKAELAYAHILSRRRVRRRSDSMTLKASSFERSRGYLLNDVNRMSKFEF